MSTPLAITFTWETPAVEWLVDGVSILVNDVERFRQYYHDDYEGVMQTGLHYFTFERSNSELPYYFRFAYVKGSQGLDYTSAGVWYANGTWSGAKSVNSKA